MAEFKQILCAIDFSAFSRRALDHALITSPDHIGADAKAKLAPLCARLFSS